MTADGKFGFGIRAFDSVIFIECADLRIRDALEHYVFPPLPRETSAPTCPDIHLRVERNTGAFNVLLNHKPAASVGTLQDAALATVKALDEAVVHRMKSLSAVHAGAISVGRQAILVPGLTHSGKSSLVAELLRRGASCFSDEYALIDSEGWIHPYPRPLLLRNGGPVQSLVLPHELHASYAMSPAPIGWILALGYVPGQPWKINRMSQGEAALLMLRNTPHEMGQAARMVDFFLRAAANAICYEGLRGEAAEAAARILDLVGRT